MGKHNGKARSGGGEKVGQALVRKGRGGGGRGAGAGRHTTEVGPNMQSVLDRNDLDEFMAMADLADKDFTAERGANTIVVSTGAVDAASLARAAAERAAAEARHAHKLQVPRRPPWDAHTTPDELDASERASFLDWRRALAHLEEGEGLLLTPFEKNLEVWRQLWRVLERSDIVVQVVDARDPLTYWSADLAACALELDPTKSSMVLLNKADLLPTAVRRAWADYWDARGVPYAFWSAAAAADAQAEARRGVAALGLQVPLRMPPGSGVGVVGGAVGGDDDDDDDERVLVLGVEELLALLEEAAASAVAAAGRGGELMGSPGSSDGRRLMVGLVGYPNVGKSSTINAIFGAKKTAVAPTPGKTKHFQTLHVSASLCLCDCPGLVIPRFAGSKADMVAAGVVPIDRLTDVRAPVEVAAQRSGRRQLEAVYGIRLPAPAADAAAADAARLSVTGAAPSAAALLTALATARGWAAGGGLPDEARAGRQILKDFVAGKLLFCRLPPGLVLMEGGEVAAAAAAAAAEMAATAALQQDDGGGAEALVAGPSGRDALGRPRLVGFAPLGAPGQMELEGLGLGPDDNAVALALAMRVTASGAAWSLSGGGGWVAGAAVPDRSGPAAGAGEARPDGGAAADDGGDGAQAAAAAEPEPLASSAGRLDSGPDGTGAGDGLLLDEADLELLDGLGGGAKQRPRRAEHKFHKKAARSKGDRGLVRDGGGYDGAAMVMGRRGGIVHASG